LATLDLAFSIKVFAALFAIMNPIANIPVFLSLTEGHSARDRRRVARTAIIGVTIGCAISAVAGRAVLHVFGLSVNDFRLAGGLLVLLIALSMLHGSASGQHQPNDKELDNSSGQDIAIYPLTIPLLVGPGTIATLIIFGQTAMAEGKVAGFVLGLAVFLALLGTALFSAPFLANYLSPKATAITQRLMGMILAAIAMQMIVASLQVSFGTIGHH
jgi:multiple antibiotic resistance protein